MAIKICLGVSELEKLIGGNEEIQLEIRQAAAAEFAKRYLKDIVNSETMKTAILNIQAGIREEIVNHFGVLEADKKYYGQYNFRPSDKFKAEFDLYCKRALQEEVAKIYSEYWAKVKEEIKSNTEYWKNEITKSVKELVTKETVTQVRAEVEDKLVKALDKVTVR